MIAVNVLFVSIDSLNRHFLSAYDQSIELDVDTPNLDRFAERSVTFDTHYAGSLPCMPARREWLTGIQEFLWRPWGPIEPFDVTLPRRARSAGILTQLITDHYHYFQHGSHGYYEDFNGFEFIRGHEIDAWRTRPIDPSGWLFSQTTKQSNDSQADVGFRNRTQYARNVADFRDENDFFAPKVFSKATEWLQANGEWDQWFCYVDSFDVHEPFHCPEPYASMYTDEDPKDPSLISWPFYGRIDEGQSELTDRQLAFVRSQFAGKITMVDHWFGHLMETMNEEGLWDDTAVIVTADHGHFLGEHGWIGKPHCPDYDVLVHTPLLVWHPESPLMGERVSALTSAVDLFATVLDLLGVKVPCETHSRSLKPLLDGQTQTHRDWTLYGYWGSSVNVTDGKYTYLRTCREDVDTTLYSAGMMNPYSWFTPRDTRPDAEAGQFLPYTDSMVWSYDAPSYRRHDESLLFNIEDDPAQEQSIHEAAPEAELHMRELLVSALEALEAPSRQFERLSLMREY